MTYDAVVIGAGLAGLTAALRLAEHDQQVLVLARGVGSTHLSAGTIDVLGYAPQLVVSPRRSLPAFADEHPEHPYGRMPLDVIEASIEWFKARMRACPYVGGLEENFLLPTAVGVPKPSAAVPLTMEAGDLRSGGKFLIVGFSQLKDFYPHYVADNLTHCSLPSAAPVVARGVAISPPMGDQADVWALTFADRLEEPEFRKAVASDLEGCLEPGDAVGFPAVLGLDDAPTVWGELQDLLGAPVFEIPTLPPSVPGMRVFRVLTAAMREAGGRVIIGGHVNGAETEGRRVRGVTVETAARPMTYRARSFVLASGGFASGGLEMDSLGEVRETIFGLPVAGLPPPDERRFMPGYFERHPMSRAGVAVDEELRPIDAAGRPAYENLYAAGATLAGAAPWLEKSGDGLSLSTGYRAASAILQQAS